MESQGLLCKARNTVLDAVLDPKEAIRVGTWLHVAQVRRQNKKRLYQRKQQRKHDDERDLPGYLCVLTGHEQPGHEGNDRGEHRKYYRLGDHLRAQHGGFHTIAMQLAVTVNTLAYNNRVVNDDTQHQQECKSRNEID